MMFPLVSISGIPGSGKSTLLEGLSVRLRWQTAQFDDFVGLTSQPIEVLEAWIQSGMPVEKAFIPEFRNHVLNMLMNGPVLIETPFGPLHRLEGLPITTSIWLSCEPDIAISRVLLKALQDTDWQSVVETHDWIKNYLSAYLALVNLPIRHQIKTVAPKCDLVIDATERSENMIEMIVAALEVKP